MSTSLGDERSAVTPPETVTEYVTEQIRDRIVLGLLKPGTKLSVYSLAEEFGVSRVPLREAVRQLEAECLVDNLARRGTVVRPLSATDLYDTFQMLIAVEHLAARRVAAAEDGVAAKEMRFWLDRMTEHMASGTPIRSIEMLHAHRAFHFALFRGAGENGVLFRHLCMLWNTAERYVVNSRTDARQEAAQCEHEQVMDRIEAGDADGAVAVLREHIHAAYAGTLKFMESEGMQMPPDDLSV